MTERQGDSERDADRLAHKLLFASTVTIALVFLGMLATPILKHRVPTRFDYGCFHLPLRACYARCLKEGQAFDWLPGMYNGLFITGEGEHGPYHPAHWFLYRFLPLDRAFALEAFAPFPLMLLGMFVFLRRHAGRVGALLGAMVYTFSANNLSHGQHINYVAVMAHLPWLLWLMDVAVGSAFGVRRRLALVGIGLLTGSQLLLGHPQVMSYSLLAEVLYACFLGALRRPFRVGAPLLAAKLLGALIGAVQLLATWEFLGNSTRTSVDPMFGSLAPVRLVQLLAPNLLSNHLPEWIIEPFYFGTVPAILLLAWWCGKPPRRTGEDSQASETGPKRLTWFAVVLGVLAVCLALGSYGGLYSVQLMLPLVKHFRAAARYLNLLGFAAAVLSALVFARLMRRGSAGERPLWSLCPSWLIVVAGLGIAVWFHRAYPEADQRGLVRSFYAGPLFLLGAALALTVAARGRRIGLLLLVLLMGLDMGLFIMRGELTGRYVWRQTERLASWEAQTNLPPTRQAGRILCLAWEANRLLLHGENLVNGYKGGIEPKKYLDYSKVAALRVSGVAWCREQFVMPGYHVDGLRPVGGEWYEVPAPLPRVRLVARTQVSEKPAEDVQRIDLDTTALVTHPVEVRAGQPGAASLVSEQPGELHVQVDAPGRQLLVIADSYDPGWQVEVDDKQMTVERVNGDFLGCVVEAGRHDVHFTFRPASIYYGRRLSLAGLAIALLIAGVSIASMQLARRNIERGEARTSPNPVTATKLAA